MFRTSTLLALLVMAIAPAAASAASSYYPKRAYFRVSLSGTMTTDAHATTHCSAGGSTREGDFSETVRFSTKRAGRVLFKTDAHRGMTIFQEDDSFESGLRPAQLRGRGSRTSALTRSGIDVAGCDPDEPAASCGDASFGDWRVSLFGRGRGVRTGLRGGGVAGPAPFPDCRAPYGFPRLPRDRPAKITKSAVFSRAKRITVRASSKFTRQVETGGDTVQDVTTKLRFTARLVRVR